MFYELVTFAGSTQQAQVADILMSQNKLAVHVDVGCMHALAFVRIHEPLLLLAPT